MLSQRQYSEIVRDLTRLESFLLGLGLHKGTDRLRQLAKHVITIDQAYRSGTLGALSDREDVEDLVWSLVDAMEFSDIYAGLQGESPAVLKPLFRKALQGTLHPGKETAYRSNIGRNTAFELRLASGIRRAGGQVQLGQRADLVIDHAGARVYVECKRPFSANSIKANIEEARKQLRKRLDKDDHPMTAGIVAISASRAVNYSGSRLFVADEPRALRNLADDLIELHRVNSADFDRLSDLRILGILYHVQIPAYVKSIPLLTSASQAVVFMSGAAMQTMFPVSHGESIKDLFKNAL
jgi:hypothetical protein